MLFLASHISVMEINEISEKIENSSFPCKINVYICFCVAIYHIWNTV